MARITPQISNDTLLVRAGEAEQAIRVGSEQWWRWLEMEGHTTFHFRDQEHGSFTARREYKSGHGYWYAYRRQQGKLHKAYLGKAEELSLEHLAEIAAQLSTQVRQRVPQLVGVTSRARAEATDKIAATQSLKAQVEPALEYQRGPIALLTTKLYCPPARVEQVARPHLLERLELGLRRKLTLLSAPAGFGKTTLLSAWQHGSQHPQAWLALDSSDNDLARFWHYLATALGTICPLVNEKVLPVLQSPPLPALDAVLTLLINSCATLTQDSVLVLDDYHLITTQSIHDSLTFMLEHLPARLHLVISSRTDPPLPLIKLRAQGQLNELRVTDLRFTHEEVVAFLRQVMGLDLTADEIRKLDEHTEGWVASLQLAALSMQGRRDTREFIANFTGSHRYVLDYLTGEVLQRQPEHIRDFLLQTAILERLTAGLCNAVTEQEDGQAMLQRLEQINLFVIPLDEERRWYRYHHLFAEFMLHQLRQRAPQLEAQLHKRAAHWFEQQNLLPEAVGHALQANDTQYAAQLVERSAQSMLMRGEVTTYLNWLEALPEETTRERFLLRLNQAGALITAGYLDAAGEHIREVELGLAQLKQRPGGNQKQLEALEQHLWASKVAWAAFRGDLQQSKEIASKALQVVPEENVYVRSIIAASLGNVYLLQGEFARANQAFNEAINTGLASHNLHVLFACISAQGYLEASQGQLHKALATHQRVIRLSEEYGGKLFPVVSMSYACLAELWIEWNDMEKAERYAREGVELGQAWGYVGMLAQGYSSLAQIAIVRKHYDQALRAVQQAEQLADAYNLDWVKTIVRSYSALIHFRTGDLNAAARWVEEYEFDEHESYNNLHDLEHLTLVQILIALRQYGRARKVLNHMQPILEQAGKMHSAIGCLVLQAVMLARQGKLDAGVTVLARALMLAEPEGYVRLFIDQGDTMVQLLKQAVARGIEAAYARKLLHALDIKINQPEEGPLSERELLILRSIAAGRTNQQIAQELVIALSTVKTHLSNIYLKLGVHSRTQAIARAKEMELLD